MHDCTGLLYSFVVLGLIFFLFVEPVAEIKLKIEYNYNDLQYS